MTNAAIMFHSEGFDTAGKLMGRQSAGESFLRGFLQHADVDRFKIWNWGDQPVPQLSDLVRRIYPTPKDIDWISRINLPAVAEVGCLFTPAPANAAEAWNRRILGPNRYSICGITHTTASAGIMDAVANLLVAPVEPWDALICTSKAVEASLEHQISGVADYLAERLGASRMPAIRLETIPLGINAVEFSRDEAHRARWRQRIGAADDHIVVLYVGRFSFHGKMHPLPMALAMERAAKACGKPIHWVWSGWAGNETIEGFFKEAIVRHAPSVTVHFLDGRQADVRFPIWSAGDVFFSLSDNIQETFGLTPVEAMAAGLPCVISDWDGYRDTVRHEVDGFRIPTRAARPGLGADLAFRHANGWLSYDRYIGNASQFVAVDIDAAADALGKLFSDPELRTTMGAAAQARARGELDWSVIVPRYQALWAELAEIRLAAPNKPPGAMNPWRPDPYSLFASYPTAPTVEQTLVTLGHGALTPDELMRESTVAFAGEFSPTTDELAAIVTRLSSQGPATVASLVGAFPTHRAGVIERGVTFLAKYGCVTLAPVPEVRKG